MAFIVSLAAFGPRSALPRPPRLDRRGHRARLSRSRTSAGRSRTAGRAGSSSARRPQKTADDTSHAAYVAQQIAFLAGALPLVVVGRRVALAAALAAARSSLLAPLVSLLYLVEQGRSYYALPATALPLAAGVVVAGRWLRATRAKVAIVVAVVALQLAALALVAPLVWPVLPERTMIDRGIWNDSFYKDEIGWPELVRQTAAAWRAIPAAQRSDTALLAQNYGEAGRARLLRPARRVCPRHSAATSRSSTGGPRCSPSVTSCAVGIDGADLTRLCSTWRVVAHIDNRWHIDNEERGRTIARCTLRGRSAISGPSEIASNRL